MSYTEEFDNTNIAARKRLQKIGQSAWDSFTSTHKPVNPIYVTKSLFSAVEGFATPILESPDYISANGSLSWDLLIADYNTSLVGIESLIVVDASTDNGDALKIRIGFDRKLEWMVFAHRDLHYAPLLPLVTPKVLECIAQAFQHIPNAILEVRNHLSIS